ncbi:hypothetical protein JCM8547_005424 [Rhodosporidiobolus lusitaniae]
MLVHRHLELDRSSPPSTFGPHSYHARQFTIDMHEPTLHIGYFANKLWQSIARHDPECSDPFFVDQDWWISLMHQVVIYSTLPYLQFEAIRQEHASMRSVKALPASELFRLVHL